MPRAFIIVALLCTGCAGNPTQPGRVRLGEPFELRAGTSATLTVAQR
jgi:hypothetical protein